MKYSKSRRLGNVGEEIATQILLSNGYTIIERNFLHKMGEIDIISQRDGIVYFFEVKTHIVAGFDVSHGTSDVYLPEYNISSKKLKSLARVIDLYLVEKGIGEQYFECHGISIFMDDSYNLLQYYITKNINIV